MAKLRDVDGARESVREAVRVEEAVAAYGYEIQPFSAGHVACLCPFHEETAPSFAISTEKQLYFCHGCGESGDVFSFVSRYEGLSHVESIRKLAEMFSVDISSHETPETKEEKAERRLQGVNLLALQALDSKKNRQALIKWASGRGLDLGILDAYGVRFSTSLPGVPGSNADVKALGFRRKSQWADAVVVPIRGESGQIQGYRNRPQDGGPKVIGPHEGHPLALPHLYGFYEARKAIREAGFAILVEGEADVWQMVAHGFGNTLGLFGSYLEEEALEFLRARGVGHVVVMPDGDKGGRKLCNAVAKMHSASLPIKIAVLPEGDPDDVLLRDGPQAIQDVIDGAHYGIEYMIDAAMQGKVGVDLTITDKLDVLLDLKSIVGEASKAELSLATRKLSDLLDMDPVAVGDFFRDEDPTPETTLLHDSRAERLVLSAMAASQDFAGRALVSLSAADFYMARHGQVFEAMGRLYRAGEAIDDNTLDATLRTMGAGGTAASLRSVLGLDAPGSPDFMLDMVKDKSNRRQLSALVRGVASDVTNPTLACSEILEFAMGGVTKIVVGEQTAPSVGSLVDAAVRRMHERMESPNLIVGHDLGPDWHTLNRTIHGLQPGRLVVLAAPSGVGKTSTAIGWLCRLGVDLGIPSLMLTFETDPDTLIQRCISHRAGVEQEAIATGYVNKRDVELVHVAAAELAAAPIKIERRGATLEETEALIRHDVAARGCQFVVIDYIQLMSLSSNRGMSRHQELGDISRRLLEITGDTNVSTLALGQINRDGAKKFTSADEKDIGEAYKIAQDADIFITFLEKSREELEVDGPQKGNRYAKVHKNRRDGKVRVGWHMEADLAVQRVREVILQPGDVS